MDHKDIRSTPQWIDHCGHNKSEDVYIGTFDVCHIWEDDDGKGQWREETYDMYLYEGSLGTEVCLRYGNEGSEYCSIGTLDNLWRAKSNHYQCAREVLLLKGSLAYKPIINKYGKWSV